MMLNELMLPGTIFHDLRHEMNRLMDGGSRCVNEGLWREACAFPSINIWEDGERFFVEAEIPGLSLNDVQVEVNGNELSIQGERKQATDEDRTIHHRERGVGTFSRLITLPVDVSPDKVEAVLKNGILTITLPKVEQAKVRKISVKTE